jgi:GNAT superfamily N-acetyltransferase
MHIYNRPFDPSHNDFIKMYRFLQQDYVHKQDRFIWLFSRLGDWYYGLYDEKKYIPTFFSENAQLWIDNLDELLGFVLSEDGSNLFFIFTAEGYDSLYTDILEWTMHNWRPRFPTLKTEVHEYQDFALAALTRQGFHQVAEVAITRQYDPAACAAAPQALPAPYTIVDQYTRPDSPAKVALYKNGFSNTGEVTWLDIASNVYSHHSPAYDASLDLSVVDEHGKHLAGCVGFIDPHYQVAEIEKICTHSAYRRQGLASAVVNECFRRLAGRGVTSAYITGYSEAAISLYGKLGWRKLKRWYHYELI